MPAFRKAVDYGTSMLVVLVLVFNNSAKAQGPVYHPGQTIRISVTFEGPDAGKVDAARMDLSTPKCSDSQPNFNPSIYSGDSKPAGRNTFEVAYKITDTQCSGDYTLIQLRAGIGAIEVIYKSPADFTAKAFKIDNPNTLVKPQIKDVKEFP
jgi:hypothetical protein